MQGSDLMVHETIPWKLRSRKSTEDRWNYNIPRSRVPQATLNQAVSTFETNKRIFDNNKVEIKENEAAMEVLSDQIIESEDASEIYTLAQSKNNLAMRNGNLQAQSIVAEKEWRKALKVIHEHRGEIGDFYLDGPHTTEFKALFGWPAVVLLGAGAYYMATRGPQIRRGMDSLYQRSPISGAFRYA